MSAEFSGDVERVDGETLEVNQLPDLLSGATLFASNRLVVVRDLSENTRVYTALGDMLTRIHDDTTLVLVEKKLDKRTKTYKALKQHGTVREFPAYTERDSSKLQQWVVKEMTARGGTLSASLARELVERAGTDQWRLSQLLDQLLLAERVDQATIRDLVPPADRENVFLLLDAALRGERQHVHAMLQEFSRSQEPHQLLGLLSSQLFQLVALKAGDDSAQVARDIGAHPFALSKLAPRAKALSWSEVQQLVEQLAEADVRMKTVSHDPWVVIERALLCDA